jgi:hypothetical protein
MAHTMLFTLGYNAPEDRLLPEDFDWSLTDQLAEAYRKVASALRPWTIDLHIAQNDGTVKGSGSHDKTGKHCQPFDPNGRLDIVRDAGAWMRDGQGQPTLALAHICWDGCMFPNEVLLGRQIWNENDDCGSRRARLELKSTESALAPGEIFAAPARHRPAETHQGFAVRGSQGKRLP